MDPDLSVSVFEELGGVRFYMPVRPERDFRGDYMYVVEAFVPTEEEDNRTGNLDEVEVSYVNANPEEYVFPVVTAPSREQVRRIAQSAFRDFGIRYPGVMDLLNFALRQGVMFDE